MKKRNILEKLDITRTDNEHGITIYQGVVVITCDTAVNTKTLNNMLKDNPSKIKVAIAKQMTDIFTVMLHGEDAVVEKIHTCQIPEGTESAILQTKRNNR